MARTLQLRPDEVRQLAQIYNVPPSLALAIWGQESSSGRNPATSSKGARGGFQVLPTTFQQFNPGGDIDDPQDNAIGGLRYLRSLLDTYGDDPELAAQAYYGGRPVGVGGKQDVTSGAGTPSISQYGRQVVNRMQQIDAQNPAGTPPAPPGGSDMARMYGDPEPDLPMHEPTPDLTQLAQTGSYPLMRTPSLSEIALDVPPPRRSPATNPMLAQMYGATDPDSGLPMDVVMGLRDVDMPQQSSQHMDSYVRGLVDTTLKGMNFG